MKPDDIGATTFDEDVRTLAQSLAVTVRIEFESFVRGDMAVSEADAERLLHIGHGTMRKRRETGSCTYHPRRESRRYWYSLYEIAEHMIRGDA